MRTAVRTFVGFGFGAIQAGLFLKEAFESGCFGRLVVAEVVPEIVAAVRGNGGNYWLNTAHIDRVEKSEIGPIEIFDPSIEPQRLALIEAIAQAEEIATAVPSVSFYTSESAGSIHRLLAAGLRQKAGAGGPRAVIYAAENHNHAAELLEASVLREVPGAETQGVRAQVRFLNTVIGKMSTVVSDAVTIAEQKLATVTPALAWRAFRVEAFNRILVSRPSFQAPPVFERAMRTFAEKDDLLPFEEAKLYGHNATHALAAYVGELCGAKFIADLKDMPGMIDFLRRAFLEESGSALIQKYGGIDELFTPEGYRAYADDLLERMVNPWLLDEVARVGRDPERKLGWNDRLIGTLRLALAHGLPGRRYAFGAAAALAWLDRRMLTEALQLEEMLFPLWQPAQPNPDECQAVLAQLALAAGALRRWKEHAFPSIESILSP
ncbi:MAG: hypothetical protein ACOYYS_23495 [Chloroflexota bacterium]